MKCILLNIQNLLGKKWTIMILEELFFSKSLSFNKIKNKISRATNRIISLRMESLEKNGLIERHIVSKKPLRVEYSLTDKGAELIELFHNMKKWSVKYNLTPKICLEKLCSRCIENDKANA